MFLKFRHRLGFESECAEVSDSITWPRFCRIPINGRVPHPATLMKLTGAAARRSHHQADARATSRTRSPTSSSAAQSR
jgi:IS5 family transposase